MTVLQATADCVKRHESELREVYSLYSTGVSNLNTNGKVNFDARSEEENEMWFLACTLVGVPPRVCGIFIVENYRNGNPIGFRTRRNVTIDIHREFRMLRNILYADHRWQNVDSTPYRDELSGEFDLRRTGQLGVAIIDLFDEEILELIELEDVSGVVQDSSNQMITSRNLIFEVSSAKELIYDIETGGWDEVRYMGPNEARRKGIYWGLRRAAIQPRESSVTFTDKNKLRYRKSWNEEDS